MPGASLHERFTAMEEKIAALPLDDVASLREEMAGIKEHMLDLYKFIEETVGVRDVSLEKKLRTQ